MVHLTPADIKYQKAHVHEDRSQAIVISHGLCIALATIAVALRFVSRKLGKTSIGLDDWMIVAALIFGLGEVIGGLLCVQYGGGKHAILLKDPKTFAKTVIATEVLYNPAIACVKFSVLLLYRRVFGTSNRIFQATLYIIGTVVFLYSWIIIFSAIFQCRPIAAAWDPSIEDAHCFKFNVMVVVFAILNSVTDLATMILPMPILWRLHTPLRKKLQLTAVFAAAGFVCIVSIYRIPKEASLSLNDAPWSDVDAAVWSVVEVCIGVVSACLPTYGFIFQWCRRVATGKGDTEKSTDARSSSSTSRGLVQPKKKSAIYIDEKFSVSSQHFSSENGHGVPQPPTREVEQPRQSMPHDLTYRNDVEKNCE